MAKSGRRVKVFEKQSVPGGCCTSFNRNGFKFNAGVASIRGCGSEGDVTKLLSELGLRDRIEFREVKPVLYKVIIADKSFIMPTGFDEWASILIKDFPGEERGITKFIDTVKSVATDMKKLPSRSSLMLRYQGKVLKEMIDEYMTAPLLKAVISSLFEGALPPSRVPALSYCRRMKAHLEDGDYFPVGGAQAIPNVFVSGLEAFGGHLELKTGVTKIIVEDGRAIGVETTDGRRIKAGFVVSNVAAMQTFGGLVSHREMDAVAPNFVDKLRGLELNVSSMVVNMGTDLDLESLGITDSQIIVHESADFEKEWEDNARGNLVDSPFQIFIPTLVDPSQAPPKKHVINIFIYAPYYLPGRDWSREEEARLTDVVIKKAARVVPDLSKHIVVQDTITPRALESNTLNTQGATAGWAITPSALPNRPEPRTHIEKLYLTGHWTSHGGVLPL